MPRRQVYRVRMQRWLPVEVRLALDGWPSVRGILLDASSEGAGLLIAATMDGMIVPRDKVVLKFRMLQTDSSSELSATIVGHYGVDEGYRRFGVVFSGNNGELASELGQIFNRRRHPRTPPPRLTPVDVLRSGGQGQPLRAGLRDVSRSGVALAVPSESNPMLELGTSLFLGLTLSDGTAAGQRWQLEGAVRRDSRVGTRRIIGVELDGTSQGVAVEHALHAWGAE